ncbi:MAG: patatin-like phospholipase family protein [Acidimicrobiales bacterium]
MVNPKPLRQGSAFVLGGGGSRGAVQVGMLAELADREIIADRVYGASVGAVNAAAYSSDPTRAGVQRIADVWTRLRPEDIFPHPLVHGPWAFFQQRTSVYANSGLREVLERGLSVRFIEDTTVPLEVVATSLLDGGERWLSKGPIVEAVLASAAIPGIFPPVSIGGEPMIDGGVVNNVPISRPIDAGLATIYVLLCGPRNHRSELARRPIEAVVSGFLTAVHSRFARELSVLGDDVDVVVFDGSGRAAGDFRDFSSSQSLFDAGRREVDKVLEAMRSSRGHNTLVD